MAVQRSSLFRISRKPNAQKLNVGLQLETLEVFVLQILPHLSMNNQLNVMAASQFRSLSARIADPSELRCCVDELSNISLAISEVLTGPRAPSALVVYQVHSLQGLIHLTLRQSAQAIQSFLKALWVAAAVDEVPKEDLALTVHRLGLAYYAVKDWQQAKALLEKADELYLTLGFNSKDHTCVAELHESLQQVKQEYATRLTSYRGSASMRAGTSKVLGTIRRLSFIPEEQDSL